MAKKKISGLPAGSALNGTELVPIVQAGTTKRTTTQAIADLGNASSVSGSGTINYLAKFTASSTLGNSILQEGTNVIGVGVTPTAWGTGYSSLQVSNTSLFGSSALDLNLASNMYLDNVGYKYISNGYATLYNQYQGKHFWSTAGSGTAGNAISFTEVMTLTAAGNLGLGKTAPLGILHLYKAAAATRVVIDGDAAQNRIITYRTGGVQRFGLYVNNTAESGANAGSDFAFRAYSDAGTLLSTPLFIKRSTGEATFASSVTATRGIFGGSTGETLTAQGITGEWTANFRGAASTGNSFGLVVAGGTNANDISFAVYNQAITTEYFMVKGNGRIKMGALPTSPVGLSAGDIYSNLGILTIV